ncbi:MAG: TolC family protein [Ekhidna sp.]|nr:TolC family protein [Ekhidna sp.]MBC6425926.1 TolC family protein [Ekhidna sp.]
MRKIGLALLSSILFFKVDGQDTLKVQDTIVLSLAHVMNMTLSFHPVVKQAELFSRDAEANLRMARGRLDPKLEVDYDLKNFKETEYYDLLTTTFKIPTRIGLDPKIEFIRNEGTFINPQNKIPEEDNFEQLQLGVAIPLGKGLFFDERRNAIRQAESFTQIAEAERVKATNKILLTVIKDYWEWYVSYQQRMLLSQAIQLSQDLFNRTIIDYEFGEAAVVDTLQAKINLQKRTVDFRKAQADFEVAKLNLGKHLWSANLVPLEIQPNVVPGAESLFQTPSEESLKNDIQFALENHPEINKLEGKRNQLNAGLRWARESLKPQVDLSYSFINAPVNQDFKSETLDFGENYKLGLDFSFPILLRKERGKLQQTQLKVQSNEFEMADNRLTIKNNIIAIYTQSIAFEDLLGQYAGVSDNYRFLLEAEIINLQNGETDIFKLNIQQDKYIEAQNEYYDALIKWEKSKVEYNYTIGIPFLGIQ